MRRRIRFNELTRYEQSYALFECARMLTAWLDGRGGTQSIRLEQAPIPHWDDVVVERASGHRVHMQIKRQTVDFCSSRADRPPEAKLSEFDNPIRELARLSTASDFDGVHDGHSREFWFVMPAGDPRIKKDLRFSNFRDLVATCRKQGIDPQKLFEGETTDGTPERLWQWLRTWCEFVDPAHVHRALRHFQIRDIGHQPDLDDEIDRELGRCFDDASEVRRKLLGFLSANASVAFVATPRGLVGQVSGLLRPSYRRWVEFHHDVNADRWTITGTTSIRDDEIEPPRAVVEALWASNHVSPEVRIWAQPNQTLSHSGLDDALARLALHGDVGGLVVRLDNPEAWKASVAAKIGGTLGRSSEDDVGRKWSATGDPSSASDARAVEASSESQEAGLLHAAMDQSAWEALEHEIVQKICVFGADALNTTMRVIWQRWRQLLGQDLQARSALLESLLLADLERPYVRGRLRVGPRTHELMADGICFLLAVCAALDPERGTWCEVIEGTPTHALALCRCASGANGPPVEVVYHGRELVSAEYAEILILPKVQSNTTELLRERMSSSLRTSKQLGAPRRPRLIVTADSRFRDLAQSGSPDALAQHLRGELERDRQVTDELTGGGTPHERPRTRRCHRSASRKALGGGIARG